MENAVELAVPLQVKLFSGRCWGSLEPLELDPISPSDLTEHFHKETKGLHAPSATTSSLQPVARCIFKESE
jgi:hypothetical protein